MKINPKDVLAGFPLLQIRDLLKRNNSSNAEIVSSFLKINSLQSGEVLKELTRLGYLEEVKDDNYITHRNTLKGNSLALAKVVAPLHRDKANRLFDEFMQRVWQVNKDDFYLYKVTKVILFGSFISDAQTINDIDIVISIARKNSDYKVYECKHQKKIKEAIEKGKYFTTFFDGLYYSEKEVRLFLKSRSRYLSLHAEDDDILTYAAKKQVFP